MTNRNFDEWLSKFRPSISSYDYYIDFEKVIKNVDEIKVELNILNSLIGSKNIEDEFEKVVTRYPETLKCIPLLLAVRSNEIYAQDEDGAFLYNFKTMNYDIEQYKVFMRKTGLFDMIANHLVNNLVDYALGIETGLDSNGRKNRGGHQMEDLVEKYIVAAGFKKNENYFKEMYLKDIESKWNIDLSALSNQGKAAKRFDFVIKTDKMIYVIETNFYGGGGSKLNETARSYKMLSQEADTIDGFTFVWFTDGIGWKSARGNLRETFEVNLILKNISFYLDNPELKELYADGFVKAICEVECSNTVYREFFEITESPQTKKIPITNFANIVTISAYLVATKEICAFISTDFVDDYEGYSFHINPSNVLAADDGIKFRVDIDESNDNKMSSIFTIVKKDDAEGIVTYNDEPNKIVIYLNPEDYSIYDTMKNYSMYNSVFFANLVIPALAGCLQEIQNGFSEGDIIDEICDDKKWFKSVMKRYAFVKGKELEAEDFSNINCFELAQLLMNESTDKSIKDFYQLAINGEEVSENE